MIELEVKKNFKKNLELFLVILGVF